MKVYEFGKRENPVLLLLPGTFCHWKGNFGHVIKRLEQYFYVTCISYDGFDETEKTEFRTMIEEVEKIEKYINTKHGGVMCAAYGCSLGGSFVGLLLARGVVTIHHAIIGSSDFDQSGKIAATVKTKLMVPFIYQYIHDGRLHNDFLEHKLEERLEDMGDYGEAMLRLFSGEHCSLAFVSKKSMENQYCSDLVTKLPKNIEVSGTQVHILYALKMGEEYEKRYRMHFRNPHLIRIPLRHEELLMLYPDKWVKLLVKLCRA